VVISIVLLASIASLLFFIVLQNSVTERKGFLFKYTRYQSLFDCAVVYRLRE